MTGVASSAARKENTNRENQTVSISPHRCNFLSITCAAKTNAAKTKKNAAYLDAQTPAAAMSPTVVVTLENGESGPHTVRHESRDRPSSGSALFFLPKTRWIVAVAVILQPGSRYGLATSRHLQTGNYVPHLCRGHCLLIRQQLWV